MSKIVKSNQTKRSRGSKHKPLLEQNLQGFTIVEFSLATAFIATLLISITVVAGMVTQIYQKGLTLKSINSIGRGLIDEFTANINAAPSVDTTSLCNSYFKSGSPKAAESIEQCKKDYANKFIFQERSGTYTDNTMREQKESRDVQLGGVFCTGSYSYVWNTYYGLNRNSISGKGAIALQYLNTKDEEKTIEDFRLISVYDPTYRVCSSLVSPDEGYSKDLLNVDGGNQTVIDIRQLATGTRNMIPDPIIDTNSDAKSGLLTASDVDLQLYELTIFPIAQDLVTLRTFMTGTFILGTERGNINIERSGDYCDVQNYTQENGELLTIGSEFTYCGINKFNFAARTAGT